MAESQRSFEQIKHQQSRVKWTILGDDNTTFFHWVASTRSRGNRISQLEFNGVISSYHILISPTIPNFYKNLFSKPSEVPFDLGGVEFHDDRCGFE